MLISNDIQAKGYWFIISISINRGDNKFCRTGESSDRLLMNAEAYWPKAVGTLLITFVWRPVKEAFKRIESTTSRPD